jgi:hypothetical protein
LKGVLKLAKAMFNAIWIGGLLCFIAGFSGVQIPGITKGEFLLAGGFLEAIIITAVMMSITGRGRSRGTGINPRFLKDMMVQEKADRSEERRVFQGQQNLLVDLLREQGRQQTEAIKQISYAVQAQASVANHAIAALSQNNQLLIQAGARLDYDERTESYVAQLKGKVWRVEPDQAETWAEIAPNQVNPKLLQSGE